MAYKIRVYCDIDWVPDGAGGAVLGVQQANSPGFTNLGNAGPVGNAQTLRLQDGEMVPGGDSPSQANFQTAFNAAATSLGALLSANASAVLTQVQNWKTGGV
jgi:hypothetical protein